MNNLVVNNMNFIKSFFERMSKEQVERYLWIPITGVTIAGVFETMVKSIKENDCEVQFRLGKFVEISARPTQE